MAAGKVRLKAKNFVTQPLNLSFHLLQVAEVEGLLNLLDNVVKIKGFLNNGGTRQVHRLEKNLPLFNHKNRLQMGIFCQTALQKFPGFRQVPVGDEQIKDGLFQQFHGLFHV
ncbi:MAG: hypothetical protein ACUVRZ_09465, partial [Desulfobacca sp.]|uniref:hypothetical protein n=1 Tax=Desulfobacca sp. TaxID=2067990 RepID=UPI0040495E7F